MNKTSLLMLFIGIIVGIVIGYGYVTFLNVNIEAEGFRDVGYADKKFNISIVKRVDADNVKVIKNVQFPAEGFLKSYTALERLIGKLKADGVIGRPSDATAPSDDPDQE